MAATISNMTPAERAAMQELGRAAKAVKAAQRKAATFTRDWLDQPYQERLASAMKLRLPPPGESPPPTVLRRFLNRVGWTVTQYYLWSGETSLTMFAARNPSTSARQWGGFVLEAVAAERGVVLSEPQTLEVA